MQKIELEFNQHFDKLIGNHAPEKIAIACSGGADSTALYHLVKNYISQNNRSQQLVIFYANHNLRPEAANEAVFVKDEVESKGDEFVEITWQNKPENGIQEKSRAWRYSRMTQICQDIGANILLTGHHQGDILEGFMMRKQRQSGAFGMNVDLTFYSLNDVLIIRPLLNLNKNQLTEYLQQKQVRWLEDASNASEKYQRNRMRSALAEMPSEQRNKIVSDMHSQQSQTDIIAARFNKVLASACLFEDFGACRIDLKQMDFRDLDVTVQLFNYVLTVIGGQVEAPRYRSLKPLLLRCQQDSDFKATLCKTCIIKINNALFCYREITPSAINMALEPKVHFDNRFLLKFNSRIMAELGEYGRIGNLSFDEYVANKKILQANFKTHIPQNHYPKNMLFTFPVVKKLEKIVAIPHISYYDSYGLKAMKKEELENSIEYCFKPSFFWRYLHI